MLRNINGPIFNFKSCVFFFGLFFKNPLLSAGRTRFVKTKKTKNTKKMDHFLTLKRAKIGPLFNFTADMYIYLYIYTHAYTSLCSLYLFSFSLWWTLALQSMWLDLQVRGNPNINAGQDVDRLRHHLPSA